MEGVKCQQGTENTLVVCDHEKSTAGRKPGKPAQGPARQVGAANIHRGSSYILTEGMRSTEEMGSRRSYSICFLLKVRSGGEPKISTGRDFGNNPVDCFAEGVDMIVLLDCTFVSGHETREFGAACSESAIWDVQKLPPRLGFSARCIYGSAWIRHG